MEFAADVTEHVMAARVNATAKQRGIPHVSIDVRATTEVGYQHVGSKAAAGGTRRPL
jgi:hypothetical protein